MKRLMIGAVAAAGAFAGLGGTAFAAPTNAPRAGLLEITCSNGATYQIAGPPGGNSQQSRSVTPGVIVGGGAIIPTTFSITFTFDGQSFTSTSTRALNNPHANDVTCTGTGQEFSVSATGFIAPSTVRHSP